MPDLRTDSALDGRVTESLVHTASLAWGRAVKKTWLRVIAGYDPVFQALA